MANSIRTPRQGVTANSRRIAQAVDDEDWQSFRLSLKGTSTESKLTRLRYYWNGNLHGHDALNRENQAKVISDCDYCIRVDNYIKALCRGGQLEAGESLWTLLEQAWRPTIRK